MSGTEVETQALADLPLLTRVCQQTEAFYTTPQANIKQAKTNYFPKIY